MYASRRMAAGFWAAGALALLAACDQVLPVPGDRPDSAITPFSQT